MYKYLNTIDLRSIQLRKSSSQKVHKESNAPFSESSRVHELLVSNTIPIYIRYMYVIVSYIRQGTNLVM